MIISDGKRLFVALPPLIIISITSKSRVLMVTGSLPTHFKTSSPSPGYASQVAVLIALLIGLAANNFALSDSHQVIQGTVRVADEFAARIEPGDRLIIKLYHPDEGIEKDQTFRVFKTINLPFEFDVGPGLDMSRRTKWSAYIVEAFIDKDNDILSVVDNELFARSESLISIGSSGLELVLVPR